MLLIYKNSRWSTGTGLDIFRIDECAPWVFEDTDDVDPALDIAIEHFADEVDAGVAHNIRHAQVVIHDFIDAIERVFLVDDGVEQDAQCPDVLFFAAIREAAQDFWGGVVYWKRKEYVSEHTQIGCEKA